MNPYVLAAAGLAMFGVWGVAAKVAVDSGGWRLAFLFANVASAVVGIVIFLLTRSSVPVGWTSVRWALLAGLLGPAGVLCMNIALERAPAGRIITITAMYPAITVLLSAMVLGERLTIRHVAGVGFALVGLALLGGG